MCFKQEHRTRFGRFLFGVLIVFSVTGMALDAPATEPQKAVLALYGSRPDLPANVIVDEIIRSTLEHELGPRLDFYAEFLDTARWPEAEAQSAFHDLLRRKYAHRKLSAIIAVAQPAINFIRIYGDELFPGVPIVVYGELSALRDWEPGRPITGTLGKVDLSGTVELILRLQPRTREILVISGASANDQWLQSLARPQLDQLEKRVKFTYLTGVAVEDLASTVARVPDRTAILFLSMFQDSAGNKLLSHEMLTRIARVARVPVYSQSGANVGRGIVGGVVFNPESLGRETAQLTLRLLRGERIQDLPVQESKSTVPMVDWRQLKRWGLDEKRLPAGTVVLFREASVWQNYKWYIIGGISLILAEALLIFGLLWQRVKRRNAENEAAVAYDQLRVAVEAGRFVGWDVDYRARKNTWFGDLQGMFGIPAETLSVQMGEFLSYVYPEDVDRVQKTIEDAKENRSPYFAEFRVMPCGGRNVRWVNARGKFYYATNGDPLRMLGMAADVTERHQAEDLVRESEERFRRVANTAPVMIWMAGLDRLCTYVNQPWLEFTGRSFDQELGNGWAEGIHPEDLDNCMKTYFEAFDRRERFEMQYRLRRHDGEYRWIFDTGLARFEPDGSFAGYIGSSIDITERIQAEEAISSVGRRLMQAQEEERSRIGRELHDDINQRLALLAVELDRFDQNGSTKDLHDRVQGFKQRVMDIATGVQALSHQLHSSKLEYLGLALAAKSFCKEFSETHNVRTDFTQNGVPRNLAEDVSICLFRILQESLQNAVKYSGAVHFEVDLLGTSADIRLTVRDDGVGFNPDEAIKSQGLGLVSMRERVKLVKGEIVIKSKPMKGTEITVRVPVSVVDRPSEVTSGAA
jgi:PAS domain S-box-containing protein